MKNIYDVLAEKERQLQQLTREVEALRVAHRLLADEQDKGAGGNGSKVSQAQMLQGVLSEDGKPMHVAEIAKAMQKQYGKKFKTTHLSALLYRYIKMGKLFYKAENKPGTFGLKEWQVISRV